MEGELFEVRVPPDIDSKQFAGLAFRHADGTLETMGGFSGWTPGELIKIVCFTPDKQTFRYACFLDRGIFRSSTTRFPVLEGGLSSPNQQRTDLAPGDRLIRYSKDDHLAATGNAEGDDFDIVFHVQDRRSEADSAPAGSMPEGK